MKPVPNRHDGAALIRRRSLPEQVVNELGMRIVRGDFARKGALPTEPELSAELGISRNVLREAIKVLASKGMIDVRPKIGMRIRKPENWNVLDADVLEWFSLDGSELRNAHDFVEFRRIIEPKASYLAALRATDEEIAEIQRAFENLFACIGHPSKIPAADIVFHRSIYNASHNVVLRHVGSLITPLMQNQVVLTTEAPGSFEKGLPLHRKVTEAIAKRDPKNAEKYSRMLVIMPYQDLASRLHPEDKGLL
jgi:GntR family galactonate operon transcriptional repressor